MCETKSEKSLLCLLSVVYTWFQYLTISAKHLAKLDSGLKRAGMTELKPGSLRASRWN